MDEEDQTLKRDTDMSQFNVEVGQQIAEALHVSNRTLQRKLREEGTSFMDLLQDTRLQLARKYLKHPGRSVVETASLLGFSEPSTFSRAFKRWTGSAPNEYKESVGQQS